MAGGGADASPSWSLPPLSAEEAASSVVPRQPPAGGGHRGSSRTVPSSPPPLTGGEFLLHLLRRPPQSQANSALSPASGSGRAEGHDDPAVAVVGPTIPFPRPPPGDFPSAAALAGAHPHGSPPWAGAGYPGFHQPPWAAPPSEFGLPRPAAPPGFHHQMQYANQYNNIASQPAGGIPSFSPPLGFQAGPFDARNIHRNPGHSQQHQHQHQQHQHQHQQQHRQQQHWQQQQQQQHYSRREGFPMEGGPLLFGSLVSAGGSRLSEGDPFLPGRIDASSRRVPVRPDVMNARSVAHNATSGYDHERERVPDGGRSSATSSFPGSNWSFQPRTNQHQGPSHRWKESGDPLLQKKQGAPLQRSGKSEPGKLPFPYKRDKDVEKRVPSSNVTNGEHTVEELAHLGIGELENPSYNNESVLSRGLPPVNQLDQSSSSLQRETQSVLASDVKEHRECLQFGNVCTVQRVEQFKNGDVEGVVCIEKQDLSSEHVTDSSEVTDEISEKRANVHVHASRGKDYRLDDSRGHHVLSQRMRYRRRELQCRRNIGGFTPSFLAIYESLIPSEEEKAKQRHLLQSLEKLVIKEWPNARLYLYGSCANSFGVSNSDIDICLAIDENDINKSEVLLKLAEILQSDNLQNVQALTRARVPIVKLMDPLTGLSCDICINNLLAVVNTKLLRDYAKIDVRLRQLAFIVKHWAKSRGVNDTYQGTLSSYAYVLMCIHFLQLRRPAILPCLQEMEVTYVVKVDDIECAFFDQVEKLRDFDTENRENIAELLWAFFNYWAYHHDYANDVISVRTGGNISKQSKDWTRRVGNDRHLICIEDPFEVTHDLGRVVDKYTIKILREEFERAAEILQYDHNPCVKLFEPYVRVPEQG